MVDWHQYLESICTTYAKWWRVYTITDVVGQKREKREETPLLFDVGLTVQTVEREREEKVEPLTVLEGLRKYAADHLLLVGRPGSGKSTALVRLVLEEAEAALTPLPPSPKGEGGEKLSNSRACLSFSPKMGKEGEINSDSLTLAPLSCGRGAGGEGKIPVLVELRYYRTSVLDLIQDFLQRHDPTLTVDAVTLKTWLRQGQLLLLVDGVNELPSEEARRELQKFRQNYQKTTPMIFTTRDLGVGGDLGIAKKLEMQPLSEAQMQQFVRAYLPEQGEQMLGQLGSRLQKFGQTPLLLMMLCSVFADNRNRVPSNLGSVFRKFTQIYTNKLKQDIPISRESRRWWQRLLEQLAWVMTCGEAKT
ncbi:NACHT domain-containing protein [Coleofasciculus sp. LEGE 07092]|uniref:NACHT domain-containing protein n=1 Tax=Coleofasciculus sp. LEGE 07092 TaxID=2777969 RepID=UPI001882907D|nr:MULTISPECIES: NACHT domain-containing protein [unclassified Coleofasciculus]MBE9128681.1 NACHT domain-containing protein [Coleofasciculus sp. LEGE 07081]MBE9147149.1 NACHT domain-containing protein [Coleofasciculus sp. LEGE 07092]